MEMSDFIRKNPSVIVRVCEESEDFVFVPNRWPKIPGVAVLFTVIDSDSRGRDHSTFGDKYRVQKVSIFPRVDFTDYFHTARLREYAKLTREIDTFFSTIPTEEFLPATWASSGGHHRQWGSRLEKLAKLMELDAFYRSVPLVKNALPFVRPGLSSDTQDIIMLDWEEQFKKGPAERLF